MIQFQWYSNYNFNYIVSHLVLEMTCIIYWEVVNMAQSTSS